MKSSWWHWLTAMAMVVSMGALAASESPEAQGSMTQTAQGHLGDDAQP